MFCPEFKTGNYDIVVKLKKHDEWSLCYRPNDLTWRKDFDYRLVHKKHKDILEHYLNGGEVSGYAPHWLGGDIVVSRDNFIETYSEDGNYLNILD